MAELYHNNWYHGQQFENWAMDAMGIPERDWPQAGTDAFDIAAAFDREAQLPTSCKTTHSDTICLSSAPLFMGIADEFRLLVGRYRQLGGIKSCDSVWEFLLTSQEVRELICAGLPLEVVVEFDSALKAYPRGEHVEARQFAQARKRELEEQYPLSHLILNPKIGNTDGQRRLQCSISLSWLIANGRGIEYRDHFRAGKLPLEIKSPVRGLALPIDSVGSAKGGRWARTRHFCRRALVPRMKAASLVERR